MSRPKILELPVLHAKRISQINRDPKIDKRSWEAHLENPRTCEWCGVVSPLYRRREMFPISKEEIELAWVDRCFVCDAGVWKSSKEEDE